MFRRVKLNLENIVIIPNGYVESLVPAMSVQTRAHAIIPMLPQIEAFLLMFVCDL